jgi:hypothetical protein
MNFVGENREGGAAAGPVPVESKRVREGDPDEVQREEARAGRKGKKLRGRSACHRKPLTYFMLSTVCLLIPSRNIASVAHFLCNLLPAIVRCIQLGVDHFRVGMASPNNGAADGTEWHLLTCQRIKHFLLDRNQIVLV